MALVGKAGRRGDLRNRPPRHQQVFGLDDAQSHLITMRWQAVSGAETARQFKFGQGRQTAQRFQRHRLIPMGAQVLAAARRRPSLAASGPASPQSLFSSKIKYDSQ